MHFTFYAPLYDPFLEGRNVTVRFGPLPDPYRLYWLSRILTDCTGRSLTDSAGMRPYYTAYTGM